VTRLRAAAVLVVLAAEVVLAREYAGFRTIWHFLVHSGIGAGLGLALAAAVSAGRRGPVSPWPWALVGQAVSVAPDVLFLALRMPHERSMDAFVGHVSVHTAPQPLLVAVAVFLLGGWAWALADPLRRPRVGLALAAGTAGVLALALALRTPLPTSLSDYPA